MAGSWPGSGPQVGSGQSNRGRGVAGRSSGVESRRLTPSPLRGPGKAG